MSAAPVATRRPRRRQSIATRISLLCIAVAVITAIIAGALVFGLIRNAGAQAARRNLGRIADVVQAGNERAGHLRIGKALQGLQVRGGVITSDGQLLTRARLVRQAVTATDIRAVDAGQRVSKVRSVGGDDVFVEGRPTGDGGVVVVQRQRDAVAADQRAIRITLIALLIAGALAALIGLLVAWRLARPLKRTAEAAHALAAGQRDIVLPARGPAEVVEVSDAVNTLASALGRSEARQRQFLLSVSHDLRTPLTAISGYAESLADGVVAVDDTAHVGAVMLGEAKRLERLVGDLLDLARLDAQDFRLDIAIIDVVALVHSAAGVWSSRCAAAGVQFRLEAPDRPVRSRTDATRVRQVLDGLFDNALRVTPAGAVIVLAARTEPGTAVVEVRDAGPGLRDEDLAVAFEQGALFERYRGVRQVGTGLGLAIVHRLVNRLGGSIEAGHAHEGGARFTVRLPLE